MAENNTLDKQIWNSYPSICTSKPKKHWLKIHHPIRTSMVVLEAIEVGKRTKLIGAKIIRQTSQRPIKVLLNKNGVNLFFFPTNDEIH